MADDALAVRALAHVRDRELGEQEGRAQHEPLHQIVLLHGKVLDGVDVLEAGDVGHEFDRPELGGIGDRLGDLVVLAEVRLDEDHLAAHVAGHFLGLLAFLFVDVEPHGHEVVHGGRDGGGPADPGSGTRDDAHIADGEVLVFQYEDLFAGDFWLTDVHGWRSSFSCRRWVASV